jgi:hypothetical protein
MSTRHSFMQSPSRVDVSSDNRTPETHSLCNTITSCTAVLVYHVDGTASGTSIETKRNLPCPLEILRVVAEPEPSFESHSTESLLLVTGGRGRGRCMVKTTERKSTRVRDESTYQKRAVSSPSRRAQMCKWKSKSRVRERDPRLYLSFWADCLV